MCSKAQKTCSLSKCVLPLVMGGLRSGVLMMAGDLMAQTVIEQKEIDFDNIDFARTAKFGGIGFFYVGPIISFWNGIMNRFIVRRSPPIEKAINRTICTQIYMAPTVNLGVVSLGAIAKEEKVDRDIIEKSVNRDFFNVMEKNYLVWPIAQFLCSPLGPTIKFVVLSIASVFWSAYLSTVLMGGNSSKSPEVQTKAKAEEVQKK